MDNDHVSIRGRNPLHVPEVYTRAPSLRSMAPRTDIDYSKYLNKAFLVKTFTWNTTDTQFSKVGEVQLPSDIHFNNFLKVPFNNSSMFRCKAKAYIQVIGTPQHQGIIIASAQPYSANDIGREYINNMMNAPHGFLIANTSSVIELELPFYSNTKVLRTDSVSNDVPTMNVYQLNQFCKVALTVLNPLVAPTSGSTSVTITVHIKFEELEFYVPFAEVEWSSQGKCISECCEDCCVDCSCSCAPDLELSPRVDFIPQGDDKREDSTSKESPPKPAPRSSKEPAKPGLFSRFTGILTTALDGLFFGAKKVTGDFLDVGRDAIRAYTGLHNPNDPTIHPKTYYQARVPPNIVDTLTTYEKLDPYNAFNRVTRDYNFDTAIDEMDVSYIVSKPQYLSTFSVATTDVKGKLLFSRPITPVQEVFSDTNGQHITANPQVLSYLTRYWSGTIKIHIQADMTNFHNCKLAIFKSYSPHKQQITQYPTYDSIQGLLVDFIEFSAGGQTQTIELPFCSTMQNLECTRDWIFNAFQHGMYYVYLAQPVVTNGNVATTVNFNVYYSMGDDARFYGYSADSANPHPAPTMQAFERWSDGFVPQGDAFPDNADHELVERGEETHTHIDCEVHRPIVNIRDLVRRVQPSWLKTYSSADLSSSDGVVSLAISDLLGVTSLPSSSTYYGSLSPVQIVRRLFLGMDGGVKLKVKLIGAPNAEVIYVPPGTYMDKAATGILIGLATNPYSDVDTGVQSSIRRSLAYASFTDIYRRNVAPRQESANYRQEIVGAYSLSPGPVANTYTGFESIFDLEIPNLNPCRFVGSTCIYDPSSQHTIDAVNDMGNIIISIKNVVDTTTTSTVFRPVQVQIDIGFTDETRLGFQIKSANLLYPSVTSESMTTHIATNFQYSSTTDPSPLLDPTSALEFCYKG